jgi:hypothetical protein
MKVKITKVSSVESPLFPTPNMSEYKLGEINENVSLPVEYTVEGELVGETTIGLPVTVNRTKRNEVICAGLFQTSAVVSVSENGFRTLNSHYIVENI